VDTKKAFLRSAIVLYFVIALEVLIMISPFAGYFYSVFNPVLLKLAAHPATRWLDAFFLPHMVSPSGLLLQTVRVAGSVLFVLGLALFLVCAAQIYTAKLRRRGAVASGLYRFVRHPQYLALGMAGLGLAVLWPRIMTLVLWLLMGLAYYALARDEERRMLRAHGDTYRAYMERTGMFLPRGVERLVGASSGAGRAVGAVVLAAVVLGGAFLLRTYTVDHLPVWEGAPNVSAVAILPGDAAMMEHRMGDILALAGVRGRLEAGKRYLAYFMPREYIMQGMIADTGGDWRLYKQHHAAALITDWVLHPFRHLEGGHAMLHAGAQHQAGGMASGTERRLIFLELDGAASQSPPDLFGINTLRVPQFMVDVDVHEARLLDVQELPHGSGWGTVPTPIF